MPVQRKSFKGVVLPADVSALFSHTWSNFMMLVLIDDVRKDKAGEALPGEKEVTVRDVQQVMAVSRAGTNSSPSACGSIHQVQM